MHALSEAQLDIWSGRRLFPGRALHELTVLFDLANLDTRRFAHAVRRAISTEPLLQMRMAGRTYDPRLQRASWAEGARDAEGTLVSLPNEVMAEVECGAVNDQTGSELVAALSKERLVPERALLRSYILSNAGSARAWLLVVHHIIADGWSIKLLVERIGAFYNGSDLPQPLTKVPRLAVRHAAGQLLRSLPWPRAWSDRRYWTKYLPRATERLDLYGTGPAAVPGVERIEIPIDPQRSARLRGAAEKIAGAHTNVAVLNFMCAALAADLARLSGAEEIAIGMPFLNRHSRGERETFGLFMRIGVVRIRIGPEDTVCSLVQRTAEETAKASRHTRWTPPNTANRHFEVMLNFHNVSYPGIGRGPIEEHWLHSGNDTVPFTLHVRTSREDGAFLLQFDLQRERFPSAAIRRAAEHYLFVLDELVSDTGLPISRLTLEPPQLTSASYRALNRTEAPYPSLRLESLFRARAAATPLATAVYLGKEPAASFGELAQASRVVSSALAHCGAARGQRIGIFLTRSAAAVSALLGVLERGCTWLPLDPAYPEERIRYMVTDAGASIVLTDDRGADRLRRIIDGAGGAAGHLQILILDGRGVPSMVPPADPEASAELEARPPHPQDIDEPAYCLYTSGSTGRPKGVVGSHRLALKRLSWMWREFPLASDEVILQKTSFNFIDSVWEIFGALLSGHALTIVPDSELIAPARLAATVAALPVRRIILVPSLLSLLLDGDDDACRSLSRIRRWFITGELLHAGVARRLFELVPSAEVYNLYGTSETFDAACFRIEHDEAGVIPIGRPVDNTRLYVVDADRRLLPQGVVGELLIAGDGIPAGYLYREELSSERFLSGVELGGIFEERCYLTGDLARLREDGVIECLGRRDSQIKVRGYRVEAAEVEQALLRHASVVRTAVMPELSEGEVHLTAYVHASRPIETRELRSHVAQLLPSWMVPDSFVLSKIPLTPSGKVDKIALARSPASRRTVAAASAVRSHGTVGRHGTGGGRGAGRRRAEWSSFDHRACDEVEERLCDLWQRVLRVQRVRCDDNFFDLGGSSLQAVRVMAAVERYFGVRLPLARLFEYPTVRTFAEANLRQHARGAALPLAAPAAVGQTPLFIVPPAGTTVSTFGALSRVLSTELPLYSFQPSGVERGEKPRLTIEELADEYLHQAKRVQERGPYLLAGRCFGGYVAYEMAQRLLAAGEEVSALIIVDSREAPLGAEQRRNHSGVRKLVAYYPGRFSYFFRRGDLSYVVRMKLRNEVVFAIDRVLSRVPVLSADSRTRNLRILRHLHTLAYHAYVAKPLACPIVMIWAEGSSDLTGERRKWESLASGGIEWHSVAGGHHDLLKEPHLGDVARIIAATAHGPGERLRRGALAAARGPSKGELT